MDKLERREKRRRIGHIIVGFVLLIHAYEHYEKGEAPWVHLIAGIVFLSIAVFHHPLSKRFKWIDGVFYLIEAIAIFYTAYGYFHHGKKALPVAYLAAGVGYMIAAIIVSKKKMRNVAVH
jgi:hypothetical protein